MNVGILYQTARTTGTFTTPVWPERTSTGPFTNGFRPVALFSLAGLAIALSVSSASPCTGIDLNAGCVPIELTGQVAP